MHGPTRPISCIDDQSADILTIEADGAFTQQMTTGPK